MVLDITPNTKFVYSLRKVPFPALFFVVFSFAIFYLFLFYCCCSSSAVAVLMVQSVPPAVVVVLNLL